MKTARSFIMFLLPLFLAEAGYTQVTRILDPYGRGHVLVNDTALIVWTHSKVKSYKIIITDLFEDSILTVTTTDSSFLFTPDIAPGEENFHFRLEAGNPSFENDLQISRVDHPLWVVNDARTCNQRITELLRLKMYTNALQTYHRYKSIYHLPEYGKFFTNANRWMGEGRRIKISCENEFATVMYSQRSGAIHR